MSKERYTHSNGKHDSNRRIRVVATGTFDLVHPRHVGYLKEAALMGDELRMIVANRENADYKRSPILPNDQRRDVVAALEAVDEARVGHSRTSRYQSARLIRRCSFSVTTSTTTSATAK